MNNIEIAAAFEELADRLALTDTKPFRFLSYRTAAKLFTQLPRSVAVLARRGELTQLDGIGPAIAEKVVALLDTGTFPALEEARTDVPDALLELTHVDGIGPKTARTIWARAGASNLDELLEAAEAGELPPIPGVGPKVLGALATHAAARRAGTLEPRGAGSGVPRDAAGEVLPGPWFTRAHARSVAQELERLLSQELDCDVVIELGGDFAGGLEVVRGAVLLALASPSVDTADVAAVLEREGWSATVRSGAIEAVSPTAIPTAIALVAAPADLAPMLEAAASPPGWLGSAAARRAPHAPIELRERLIAGELDTADIPHSLVAAADLVGDLHTHSTWSDGDDTILVMARAARARGDRHIVVTDHSAPYSLVNGLGPDRLKQQAEEIAAANEQLEADACAGSSPMRVLQGSEVEILADGSLGLDDATLETLDWVVASIHTGQQQTRDQLAARMARVLENPLVDQVGHPTSRLVLMRERTALDVDLLIEQAAAAGVVLEINANPRRLDLDSTHAARAIAAGVRLAINTDAHAVSNLEYREHGIAVARRAGAAAVDIVNCLEWEALAASRRRIGAARPA